MQAALSGFRCSSCSLNIVVDYVASHPEVLRNPEEAKNFLTQKMTTLECVIARLQVPSHLFQRLYTHYRRSSTSPASQELVIMQVWLHSPCHGGGLGVALLCCSPVRSLPRAVALHPGIAVAEASPSMARTSLLPRCALGRMYRVSYLRTRSKGAVPQLSSGCMASVLRQLLALNRSDDMRASPGHQHRFVQVPPAWYRRSFCILRIAVARPLMRLPMLCD